MSTEIIPLKSFATEQEASLLVQLLQENEIQATLKKDKGGNLDKNFEGDSLLNEFTVFVPETEQARTEEILHLEAKKMISDVSLDHYLFEFTNEELEDVLVKYQEWSDFDVALSEKILTDRGIEISTLNLNKKRSERMDNLSTAEGGQTIWVIIGYITAFIGGFFGLLIGYFLWRTGKQLPNGQKVPAYNTHVRNHGKIIFFISAIIFPIAFFLKMADKISLFSGN